MTIPTWMYAQAEAPSRRRHRRRAGDRAPKWDVAVAVVLALVLTFWGVNELATLYLH